MGINYAGDVQQGGVGYVPDGWDAAQWHRSALGHTNTSHTLPGRLYIVQCEWCSEAFAAHTKAKAMEMFRTHETEMLTANQTIEGECNV